MRIVWTHHSEERQKEWEKRLGITREQVENVLRNPEQIAAGYRGTLVAQARCTSGLLRVPFVEAGKERKILTVYWTSKVNRYWEVTDDANSL